MLPPQEWLYHQRYSPARMRDTWVGYPVQANLWRLPRDEVMGIVKDLAQKEARPPPPKPRNFKERLLAGARTPSTCPLRHHEQQSAKVRFARSTQSYNEL